MNELDKKLQARLAYLSQISGTLPLHAAILFSGSRYFLSAAMSPSAPETAKQNAIAAADAIIATIKQNPCPAPLSTLSPSGSSYTLPISFGTSTKKPTSKAPL